MTDEQKIDRVQMLLMGDSTATDSIVSEYLSMAEDAVLNRRYPFGIPSTVTSVPTQYESIQCELASRYFARRGGLGELSHNENGINRTWESVDDEDVLSKVIPFAKVV